MSKLSKKTKKFFKKNSNELTLVGAFLAGYFLSSEIKFTKNMKLAVLGPEQSGKTSFKNFLKEEKPGNPKQTTYVNEIEECKVTDSEGHTITIRVKDISGQADFVAIDYKERVTDYDFILFFFNSKDFMTDEVYSTDVVDRIGAMAYYINSTKDSYNKTVYIVPTFKDEAEANGITDDKLQKELYNKLHANSLAKQYENPSNILPMYQTNDIPSLTDLRNRIFASYIQNPPKWKKKLSSIFRQLQQKMNLFTF